MNEASGLRGRGLFVLTIFTGSFLLFLVQPMVARMALPKLGGAPAVWNSAMLVYHALLLAGYSYAHRLSREAPKRQAGVHLARDPGENADPRVLARRDQKIHAGVPIQFSKGKVIWNGEAATNQPELIELSSPEILEPAEEAF